MPEAMKAGRTQLCATRRGDSPLLDTEVDWLSRKPDCTSTASAAAETAATRRAGRRRGVAAQGGAAAREQGAGSGGAAEQP